MSSQRTGPPQIRVEKDFHTGHADVMADLAKTGFWPTTFVSRPSPPPHLHWHAYEVHGYVMDGTTWIEDGETGERLDIGPGDKLVLPPGALHIEGESDGDVTYVLGIATTRSFAEVFELHPADSPERPTN